MQISDFVNQYHNVSSNSANISGVEQYTNATSSLKAGHIFEGSVNSIKDGQVIIGLSSGQTLNARLDSGVSLVEGSSLFFQVKSNEGGLIQIRPVPQMETSNPTLLNALDVAGVITNEKTLSMVDTMMKNQMPIDSESIVSMNRAILSHPDIEPTTIVSMSKYSIPLTSENAAMYENYIADKAQISNSINQLTSNLSQVITLNENSASNMINLNNQIVSVFLSEPVEINGLIDVMDSNVNVENFATELNISDAVSEGVATTEQLESQVIIQENLNMTTIGTILSDKSISSFEGVLIGVPGFSSSEQHLFNSDGSIKLDVTPKEMLKAISDYVSENSKLPKDTIKNLFSHDVYSKLLSSVIEDEWSLFPTQVNSTNEISKLYERILRNTNSLENILNNSIKNAIEEGSVVKNALSDIKNNVSFMNDMNNFYNFIQIPLKLNSKLENSELYVYQNRRGGNSNEDELSAFLHFDLPALGSTDISVKLLKKNVTCNWYLENEKSMDLIESNIGLLEKKLQDMGYNCSFKFESSNKGFNFENDFLLQKKEVSASKPIVHRYSFDVRA